MQRQRPLVWKADVGIAWIDGTDFARARLNLMCGAATYCSKVFSVLRSTERTTRRTSRCTSVRSISVQPIRRATIMRCSTWTVPELRLATPSRAVPGGVRKPRQLHALADRLGTAAHRRQGPEGSGICRIGRERDARGAQTWNARSRHDWLVGRQQQRRRFCEPAHHAGSMRFRNESGRPESSPVCQMRRQRTPVVPTAVPNFAGILLDDPVG